jgi:hypothetical protein
METITLFSDKGTTRWPISAVLKYSADQERDERGRWSSGGGSDEWTDGGGGFTQDHLAAVADYQVSSQAINALLRSGKNPTAVPTSEVRTTIDKLDSAFRAAPLTTEPMTLYRGVTARMASKFEDLARNHGVYTDKGYCSTTSSKAQADEFARWSGNKRSDGTVTIDAPAGTRILQVDDMARNLGSSESLLPRGTSFSLSFEPDRVSIRMKVLS